MCRTVDRKIEMSILAEKPINPPASGKCGSAQAGQKNSVFPDLKSPDEIGRISPQRPLNNFWAELLSPRHESVSKIKGISEKVTKLYRNFMVAGDE
jgi:hypothetical protein